MKTHHKPELSLREIASFVGVSYSYVCRTIKRLGITPVSHRPTGGRDLSLYPRSALITLWKLQ